MTDRIALWLAVILAALIAADLLLDDGQMLLFLGRKFIDLMDWVEFWR